jgi:hypothetical protein
MISTEYVAGFFDGEGCVNISTDRYGKPYLRILVVNTDKSVLEKFQEKWGGDITHNKRHKENWKRSFTWRLSHTRAIEFLQDLEPFLIVKKKQANLAVEFCKLKPGKGSKWTEDSLQEAKTVIEKIKAANKKGVEV